MTEEAKKSLKSGLQLARKTAPSAHPTSNEPLAVDIPLDGSKKNQEKLTAVVNEMCKSPAGKMILEQAAEAGYELTFDPEAAKEGIYGYADPSDCVCALSTKNTIEENIVTLAHELRHAYQFGFSVTEDITCRTHDTKTKLHLDKTMEADAESFGCLVAWELKEAGLDKCWKDFAGDFPEVAGPFEKTMKETKDVNQARTAAFLGWYDNADRRDSYDDTFLMELKRVAPSQSKRELKSMAAAEMINEFCCDPDQDKPYFTADPAILEKGKYVTVYEDVKQEIVKYHDKRNKAPGRIPDKSIDELETQPRPKSDNGRAASIYAKKIAIANNKKKTLGDGIKPVMGKKQAKDGLPLMTIRLVEKKGR